MFTEIITALCLLFLGCSGEWFEQTNALIREYRKNELPPHYQKVKSGEYWWGGQWQSPPSFGCNGPINIGPIAR
jgi:hypothetical protein